MKTQADDLSRLQDDEAFDLVVIGAGGAGMSAALFGAIQGLRVLLVERTEYVGGTTAYSAGTTWIVGSAAGRAVNPDDDLARARHFLDQAVGERSPQALREAFLRHGAEAVACLEQHSQVHYQARAFHIDYMSELEGSTRCGRAIEPKPFDGRLLGPLLRLVRPPIPEFTVLGGMMVDRDDIAALLGFQKSLRQFVQHVPRVARILLRHLGDRLWHGRGTRLVMGNALIARLLLSLAERDVGLLLQTEPLALARDASGAVSTLTLRQGEVQRRIRVRGGVVLASGGFNRDPELRRALLPGADAAWCPGAPGHTGQAQALARQLGARMGQGARSPAFWAPVSTRRRADGSTAVFPHFIMDRGKPGVLTVNQAGERFLNESISYHAFGLRMQEAQAEGLGASVPAWMIADAQALTRYGMGMVRPGTRPGSAALAPYLADGYLVTGATLAELAQRLGMDPGRLAQTVARFNAYAAAGVDADFARGTTDYQQANGDPAQGGANPCLGALATGPFYALRLYPGDIGAAVGLQTDEHARVLGADGQALPGLYACGNDMHSIMGGVYPAPGITLGPGLAFAYIAARHAHSRCQPASA